MESVIRKQINVPLEFRQQDLRLYPGDNKTDFEYWYSQNHGYNGNRIYLGILWTSYYKTADYGKSKILIRKLQSYLDHLNPKLKYYCVVQYDDGILNDVSHLDIKVFSMSGRPMDYPLPLICQPHAFKPLPDQKRVYFANFIGNNTHDIRSEILKIRQPGWYIETKHHKFDFYCNVLASSVFTLCPRGYGPTSFRIMEALQYGSIPVFCSDKFIIPHLVPFNYYGVLVRPEQVKDLVRILKDVDVKAKQLVLKEVYDTLFTYAANKRLIEENV